MRQLFIVTVVSAVCREGTLLAVLDIVALGEAVLLGVDVVFQTVMKSAAPTPKPFPLLL